MATFPGAVSTDSDLYIAVNQKTTQLTDNPLTIGATTANVVSTSGFPTVGFISIDGEIIKYTGLTGTSFTGLTRGQDGTSAAAHVQNSQVYHNVIAIHHNVLKDEIKAEQQFISDVIGRVNTKIQLPDGSNTNPSHTFASDNAAGMYRRTSNTLSFAVGGVAQFEATLGGVESFNDLTVDTRVKLADGTVSAPAFTFAGGLSTGIYRTGATSMRFASNGVNQMSIISSGVELSSDMVPNASGTRQIGVTGNVFLSVWTASVENSGTGGVAVRGRSDNAVIPAGFHGETIESSVATNLNAGTSTQWTDLTNISLTAGSWLIYGSYNLSLNGATATSVELGISTTSGNSGTGLVNGDNERTPTLPSSTSNSCADIAGYLLRLSATTTVYLKSKWTFSAGTPRHEGVRIRAIRIG